MARTMTFCRLLGALAAIGCGLCRPLSAADDPPSAATTAAAAAPADPAAEAKAGEAKPALELTTREGATIVFAGAEVLLHVDPRPADPITGKLIWQHTVENRTLSAGEVAVKPNEPIVVRLRIPALKEAASLQTEVTLSLVDDPAKGKNPPPRATLKRRLWIVDPDAFAGRKKWLKTLDLVLYDPVGDTARVFEKAEMPFTRVTTLAALESTARGIVVIGERIDLSRVRAVGDSMFLLVGRGIPVVCLAPEKGDLPCPAVEGRPALALRFESDRIVTEVDKRLSAAAWSTGGETKAQRFLPTTIRNAIGLRVSGQPIGWPWIEAVYPHDPHETKLILCGYPIVATWETETTARYLLAGILEKLDQPKETAAK